MSPKLYNSTYGQWLKYRELKKWMTYHTLRGEWYTEANDNDCLELNIALSILSARVFLARGKWHG